MARECTVRPCWKGKEEEEEEEEEEDEEETLEGKSPEDPISNGQLRPRIDSKRTKNQRTNGKRDAEENLGRVIDRTMHRQTLE